MNMEVIFMDDFLSDIYTILFAKWILLQEVPDYKIKVNDEYTEIHFYNKHADIEIVFNPMNIIEFKATIHNLVRLNIIYISR